MILFPLDIALRSERVTPVSAFDVAPPLIMIGEWNFVIGRRKHHRACDKIFSRRRRKFFLRRRPFRNRDVAGRLNKLLELFIRHRCCVHPKALDPDAVNGFCVIGSHRHLVTTFAVYNCAHREFAARNPHHFFWRFTWRLRFVGLCRCECGPTLLRMEQLCQSRAETDNCNKSKNDPAHFSLRSLLRYLRRLPQFSCRPRLDLKASYRWSLLRSCR